MKYLPCISDPLVNLSGCCSTIAAFRCVCFRELAVYFPILSSDTTSRSFKLIKGNWPFIVTALCTMTRGVQIVRKRFVVMTERCGKCTRLLGFYILKLPVAMATYFCNSRKRADPSSMWIMRTYTDDEKVQARGSNQSL